MEISKRIIKFRAFSVSLKEMRYDINFDNYNNKYWKIMECTSFKDFNGKEIYEGVILLTNGVDGKLLWVVAFGMSSDVLGFNIDGLNHNFSSCHNEVWKKGIVIGNIYENPELIKKRRNKK